MAYSSLSIRQLIKDINRNEYYLPAIQRKFVWGEGKICKLFNSIMQDYPIGTFLFWELTAQKARNYTFYEFLKNYHERDSKNQLVNNSFSSDIRGVLDGQQRISSMYIALQGVYCTKKKYAKTKNNNAYPERQMYINLLNEAYEFKFLTDKDAQNSKTDYFYLVRNILDELEYEDAASDAIVDKLVENEPSRADLLRENRELVTKIIDQLINKFDDDQLVSYFKIINKDLDDILDIFVRVNSGGTILSKSDLLFSTLVAHWENGRGEIEKLISDMNGEDGLFNFNTDFLMRTCLFLIDAPMNFKVHTFNSTNINKIKDNWDQIRKALIDAAALLRDFGFNKKRLSSNYAATPLAYYLYKGGKVDSTTKPELRKLIVHSLLKQIYSGQADTALSGLREGLRTKSDDCDAYILKAIKFDFSEYKNIRMSGGKKLTIDTTDIENFLEYKKGAFSFLLLSMLYPDLKLDQISFHQDHMHPHSKFKPSILKGVGIDGETIKQWQDMRDKIPNLQLLEGRENTVKQATDLSKWVNNKADDATYYRKRNYILDEQSLELEYFEDFFTHRKQLLRKKLYELFDVTYTEELFKETV
ncbi:DUF262 domain-containing protein [Psychrobacter sp. AOP7-D1-15]|uniref:DUF262 domain-containing protein n=1 Tax=unclassified Psychrobacter TaxID=196806 RepID=UPI001868A03C|nr:DUF262 domain-containing protein [Psychrobacter sp. FME61]